MKRFVYRLQRLLDLRHTEENRKLKALGEAMQTAGIAREKAQGLRTECEKMEQDVREMRLRPMKVGALAVCEKQLQVARDRVDRAHRAWLETERIVEKARKAYIESAQERQALERLRAKQLEEWHVAVESTDQKQNDETAARMRRQKELLG